MSTIVTYVFAGILIAAICFGCYALVAAALQYALAAGFGVQVGFWPLIAGVFAVVGILSLSRTARKAAKK